MVTTQLSSFLLKRTGTILLKKDLRIVSYDLSFWSLFSCTHIKMEFQYTDFYEIESENGRKVLDVSSAYRYTSLYLP